MISQSVHDAIVNLLRARSGRVEDFEADLNAALDNQPEGCKHSELMVDGIRWASRAISAAHNGTALARLQTPDGAAFTWSFRHSEKRARTITQAIHAAIDGDSYPGVTAIAAERRRQKVEEGWTHEHDDGHANGEMARAAACYALIGGSRDRSLWDGDIPNFWPWSDKWWKPRDRRADLVRAGALIAAEIDRLDRLEARRAPALSAEMSDVLQEAMDRMDEMPPDLRRQLREYLSDGGEGE